jgi:peptidoglycan hydrolase CwlO-like protein
MKDDSQENNFLKTVLLLASIIAFLSAPYGGLLPVVADELTEEEREEIEEEAEEIDEEIDDKEDELEELEEKAEEYRKMIDIKNQQKKTLQNQLNVMNLEIGKMESEIRAVKEDIARNQREIGQLQGQIENSNREMEKKREELREVVRLFYRIEKEFSLEVLAHQGDLTQVFHQADYLDKTSQKIDQILKQIEKQREQLEGKKVVVESKNDELLTDKAALDKKMNHLEREKAGKRLLLEKTKGEEGKYQDLLANIEEQKQELIGDIDNLSAEKQSELAKIQSGADKPKRELASTRWYYAQTDSRWANDRIGNSNSSMNDYGCAISSVAMVFTYHGEEIDPGDLADEPIFYWDLIVWPTEWDSVELESSTYHGNIDWGEVDDQIEDGNPVIVFVKSTKSRAGHYVVVHGKDKEDYIVHDPIFGPNIYLGTTRKLVGAIYDSGTVIDQMIIYND